MAFDRPGRRFSGHFLVFAAALLCASTGNANDPPASDGVLVREGTARGNGITIAYESFGLEDSETVLMIMGNGAQLTAWPVELCEELVKRGYRVVTFDNRDVGLSTKFDAAGLPDLNAIIQAKVEGKPAPMAYTLDDMAKDAVGLLDGSRSRKPISSASRWVA